jgi:hypothetical protein
MVSACAASVKQDAAKTEPLMAPQTTCSETSCPIRKPQETSDINDVASQVVEEKCPEGMAYVSGEYCSKPNHDLPQYDETGIGDPECAVWMEKPCNMGGTHPSCMFARCAEYKPTAGKCLVPTVHKEFCIDKYEYTNKGDMLPLTMIDPLRGNKKVNYFHAKGVCAEEGKRLCYETEWEMGCQGEENRPYATGFKRPDGICNIDVLKNLAGPDGRMRKDLLVPSGSMSECHTPGTNIYDLNGNEDEIVIRDRSPHPGNTKEGMAHDSDLKGGHYAPIRARCHPATTSHSDFYYNQVSGFRCCKSM